MLRARIHAAPTSSSLREALQILAMALFDLNRLWLRDARARGLDPPPRASECRPPWCSERLSYIPWRGEHELDVDRDYFDGPMMFHQGEGTCLEIAAYDAAAMVEIDGMQARPEIVGEPPRMHCVVLLSSGATIDPTAGLQAGDWIATTWP